MLSFLFKITTPDPLSSFVIEMSLLARRDFSALKFSLCIGKSEWSMGEPLYAYAKSLSRARN